MTNPILGNITANAYLGAFGTLPATGHFQVPIIGGNGDLLTQTLMPSNVSVFLEQATQALDYFVPAISSIPLVRLSSDGKEIRIGCHVSSTTDPEWRMERTEYRGGALFPDSPLRRAIEGYAIKLASDDGDFIEVHHNANGDDWDLLKIGQTIRNKKRFSMHNIWLNANEPVNVHMHELIIQEAAIDSLREFIGSTAQSNDLITIGMALFAHLNPHFRERPLTRQENKEISIEADFSPWNITIRPSTTVPDSGSREIQLLYLPGLIFSQALEGSDLEFWQQATK